LGTPKNVNGEEQSQEHVHNLLQLQGDCSVLASQIVNSTYYCDVLRQLNENVQILHPDLWQQKNWLLHHYDPPSHTSFFTMEFLTKSNMTVISHPPSFSVSLIVDKTERLPFLHN
jgi:hypothetical protein